MTTGRDTTKQSSGEMRRETAWSCLLFKKHANFVEIDHYAQRNSATKRHRSSPNLRAKILAQ
jgi:hypothetical protein